MQIAATKEEFERKEAQRKAEFDQMKQVLHDLMRWIVICMFAI